MITTGHGFFDINDSRRDTYQRSDPLGGSEKSELLPFLEKPPIDWTGLILLAIGVTCLQFLLDKGEQFGLVQVQSHRHNGS